MLISALGIPGAFPETENEPQDKLVSHNPVISFDRPVLISNMLMRTLAYPSIKIRFDLSPTICLSEYGREREKKKKQDNPNSFHSNSEK